MTGLAPCLVMNLQGKYVAITVPVLCTFTETHDSVFKRDSGYLAPKERHSAREATSSRTNARKHRNPRAYRAYDIYVRAILLESECMRAQAQPCVIGLSDW